MALALICLCGCATPNGPGGATRPIEVKSMAHPFLFFSSDEVPRLRAEAGTTRKAQFERLQAWGKLFADFEPLPPPKLPDNRDVLQVYHENGAAYIFNMSLLYQLTGEERWLEAARRWLVAFCEYPADTGGNYSVGAYALAVAAGYDMLYPRLTQAQRDRARSHLAAIVDRGRKGTQTDWWAGLLVHHDHWLPAAGLCIGAAAVAAETPGGRERLQFLLDHFRCAIDACGEDGSWTEGVGPANYTWCMTAMAFEAVKRAAGEDLFKLPVVRGYLSYRLCQWLPGPGGSPLGDAYIAQHDSGPGGRYNVMGCASSHVLRKLAAEFRDGRAQWLADREEQVDMRALVRAAPVPAQWATDRNRLQPALHAVGWDFLWYDPTVAPQPPGKDLPDHFVFPNQGLTVLRSGWEANDVVFTFTCAPMGGRRARELVLAGNKQLTSNMGHIHTLAGAFNLFAGGNYLAVGAGYGMRESRNESTLTINGSDQRMDPKFDAKIVRQEFGKDYAYLAGEAEECYPAEAGVTRWVRHVAWLKPDVFVIGDELVGSSRGRSRDRNSSNAGETPTGRKGETPSPRAGKMPATRMAETALPHMGETAMPRAGGTPATGRAETGMPQTVWRMDYDPEHGNDVTLDEAAGAFRLANADPNKGSLNVQFVSLGRITLTKEIVRPPGANWIAFAQVRADARDIFEGSPPTGIVAVLTVMGRTLSAAGGARDVLSDLGAVVDQGNESRAAIFMREEERLKWEEASSITRLFHVEGRATLTCFLFSLPTDKAVNLETSCQPLGNGRFLHVITVGSGPWSRGSPMKTTPAGTLIVTSKAAE